MEPEKLSATALLIGLLLAAPAISRATADTIQEPPAGRNHPAGPPPEAYGACVGKKSGEAVIIETPHGDSIEAVCKAQGDRLVAKPLNGPPPIPDKEQE